MHARTSIDGDKIAEIWLNHIKINPFWWQGVVSNLVLLHLGFEANQVVDEALERTNVIHTRVFERRGVVFFSGFTTNSTDDFFF